MEAQLNVHLMAQATAQLLSHNDFDISEEVYGEGVVLFSSQKGLEIIQILLSVHDA